MSVYSGFATRMLESQYNGLVCKLISLFEQRVSAALRSDFFDNDQWSLSFCAVFKAMRKLEGQKYLPPKFSHYCKDLAQHLGAYVSPSQSQLSRDISMNSSRMSSHLTSEWDANLHQ